MNHVKSAVRAAQWRLWAVRFLARFSLLLTTGVVALFVATLLDRLLGVFIDWSIAPYATLAAAFLVALVWTTLTRPKTLHAARELDERAGLRESLSTALCVEHQTDTWSKAVVLTAEEKARTLRVSQAIPIEAPSRWYVPAFAILGTAILWMSLPRYDLLGLFAKREQGTANQQEILQVKAEVKAKDDKLAEMLAKAGVELKKEDKNDDATAKPPTELSAEEIRRAAVRKLTDVNEKLNQMQQSERQQQLQGLKDQMKQLKQPGPGPLQELSKNMAKGDFAKAQENLQDLQKKLEDSKLSPQEKEQLTEQLKNLSEQLKNQAAKQEELKNLMQKAGMDKKTAEELAKQAAKNPDAVKKALEQMKNLAPEDQKKLMDSAMAMAKSMAQSDKMGEAMKQASQGMSQEGMSKEGQQAMQQMEQQLSEMEQMAQEGKSLEAAMSEAQQQMKEMGGKCDNPGECSSCKNGGKCEGGNCKNANNGMWRRGDSANQGKGSGGPGRGDGQSPEQQAADYKMDKKKANTKTGAGPIISTRLVQGDQVRGESTADFESAVETAKGEAAEALENNRVPREYQKAVQSYFGTLEKKAADAKSEPAKSTETK
jgi:hypothetical protein